MNKEDSNKNKLFTGLIIISVLLLIIGVSINLFVIKKNRVKTNESNNNSQEGKKTTGDFNIDIIKSANKETGNYLISPYSIEMALAMLKEGASGTTLDEFNKVIPKRNIKTLSVKDRISVANALFIKDKYKNKVRKSFSDILVNKYSSELLYDSFVKPDVINNWVNNKTNGMIEKVLDSVNGNFVLGLANALAIDVDWRYQFECQSTNEGTFTVNNTVKKVEMMHSSFEGKNDVKYIKTNDEIGIVLPYFSYKSDGTKVYESDSNTTDLEFIAVLPNNDLKTYIDNISNEKLNNIINGASEVSNNYKINLSLPRFEYDYDWNSFKKGLETIGLKEAMGNTPNFSNMLDNISVNVGQAVHKTHISLNEKGTKAAAITFFGLNETALPEKKEVIEMNFSKPFMYIIRDKKSGELLFFGVVREPNLWKGTTCSEID